MTISEDLKQWYAIACPTTGVRFDLRTLELLDTDHDGRVRSPEIEAALQYLKDAGSNRLKIIMDGANLLTDENMWRMDDVFEEAFGLLGEDIVIAHAKDFRQQAVGELTAAGEGVVHWNVYMNLLKDIGWNGPVHLHNLPEDRVGAALEYLGEYFR